MLLPTFATMTLFAALENETVAALLALAIPLGGGVAWLAGYLSSRRKELRSEKKEDEKTIVDHQDAVIQRLDKEATDQRIELKQIRDLLTKMTGHLRYLEGVMESRGIPFRPWDDPDTDGSGPHKPLSQPLVSQQQQTIVAPQPPLSGGKSS